MSDKTPSFDLNLVNLHNEDEFETLRQQRIKCGWNSDPRVLRFWRTKIDEKVKNLFWITLADGTKVGHVSLDCFDDHQPPDLSLANSDGSLYTIASFWIANEQRSLGLGRATMDRLEDMATKAPYGSENCVAVTVNTLDRRYIYDDGEEWRGVWETIGEDVPPKSRSNEDWYTRRGYVRYKSEPRYPSKTLDGREFEFYAVFLRKELR